MSILDGKAAIVTGGGRGIGKGHCLALARCGASVIVNDIDRSVAAETVEAIEASGGKAVASDANIASREGAEALIGQCVDAFGAVDILVNNAGNLRDRSFLKMSDEEFDSVWQVHVKGTFWCSQTAALAMREAGRGGAIVNTTSGAHFGSFGQTNYAAAKGAIGDTVHLDGKTVGTISSLTRGTEDSVALVFLRKAAWDAEHVIKLVRLIV